MNLSTFVFLAAVVALSPVRVYPYDAGASEAVPEPLSAAAMALPPHPRLLLSPEEITALKNRASANTAEWQALKRRCDRYVDGYVFYPNYQGDSSSVRIPGSGTGAGVNVLPGYNGEDFLAHAFAYGACYLATKSNPGFDQGLANKYGQKLRYMLQASTRPPARLTKNIPITSLVVLSNVATITTTAPHNLKDFTNIEISSSGNARLDGDYWVKRTDDYTLTASTVDAPDGTYRSATVSNVHFVHAYPTAAGQPLTFLSYGLTSGAYKPVNVGDTVTVSGVLGATNANGTWKVTEITSGVKFSVSKVDGSPAPVSDGGATNNAHLILRDGGYGMRNYGVFIPLIYDWAYDLLTEQDKLDAIREYNRYVVELERQGTLDWFGWVSTIGHPSHNYFAGWFQALAFGSVAFGDENPQAAFIQSEVDQYFSGPSYLREYFDRWMSGGGYPQGFVAYGNTAVRNLLLATLAMKQAGVDWTRAPHNWQWPEAIMRYYMQFVTPARTELDDNNYIATGSRQDAVRVSGQPVGVMTTLARKLDSSLAPKVQNYYLTVRSAIADAMARGISPQTAFTTPEMEFLFFDPRAPAEDFTTLPRTYYGLDGNYGVTRSDWGTDATYLTFDTSLEIDNVDQGKVQYSSGAVSLRRGRDRLLVYGLGEAVRAANLVYPESGRFWDEGFSGRNRRDNLFLADRPGGQNGAQGSRTQCTTPDNAVPAINKIHVPATHSDLTLKADLGYYVYWKGESLHCNSARSAVDSRFHQQQWDRHVLYVRPKTVVIYDVTRTLLPDDDRFVNWVFSKTAVEVAATGGVKRFDVADGAVFKGSATLVYPNNLAATLINHNGYDWLQRVEVRPPALNTTDVNFLAVFDTADAASKVERVAALKATNLDAVELSSSGVVGFVPRKTVTLPISYAYSGGGSTHHTIVGLAPNTPYDVETSAAGRVTVTAGTGGAKQMIASPAGVLSFLGSGEPIREGIPPTAAISSLAPGTARSGR